MKKNKIKNILVIGGAGYLGSVLVPRLVDNYSVTVFDNFWFWSNPLEYLEKLNLKGKVEIIDDDIRKPLPNFSDIDLVINLACISNDLSSDLSPTFTHSVSYSGVMNVIDSFRNWDKIANFIHISSNSVYGSRGNIEVYETLEPKPLTQYSKLKVEIENYLEYLSVYQDFPCVILRPSTLCGYSPRMRLDLVCNIFAFKAWKDHHIEVHGGSQYRPAIHIIDMCRIIEMLIESNDNTGEIYNCGYEQDTVLNIAKTAQGLVSGCSINVNKDVQDERSYKTNSDKLTKKHGFKYIYDYKTAMQDVIHSFETGTLVENSYMRNIDRIKDVLQGKNLSYI